MLWSLACVYVRTFNVRLRKLVWAYVNLWRAFWCKRYKNDSTSVWIHCKNATV